MSVETLIGRYLRRIAGLTLTLDATPTPLTPVRATGAPLLLYVHVPYCETLCPFCTFHRVRFDPSRAPRYFAALRTEIRRYWERGFRFADVYFGGGTPTVMPDELRRTIELLRSLGLTGQVSIETNPDHLCNDITEPLHAAGVNRLSVGVQSFDDRLLKEMGRYERYGSGEEIARRLADTQGLFDTLNADLIFNFPHQSTASLHRDIAVLHDVGVDQVSYYPLMPATSTRRAMSRAMGEVDFAREKKLYFEILRKLQPAYSPSSAWCFARGKAMIDEYIVDHDEYLGVGSGSFSYLDGTMYSTSFSINRYVERIERGETGVVMRRVFNPREQLRYAFLVGLFGLALPRTRLIDLYGADPTRVLWKELLLFRSLGAIRTEADVYKLTDRGMYLWVVMMREFLMGVNRFREQMRRHVRSEQRARPGEIAVPAGAIAHR